MPEILGIGAAVTALVVFRRYAARQVVKRRGRFVWAFAFPMILGPAVLVWAGAHMVYSGHALGALLVVTGALLGGVELLFFRRASRAVSATPVGGDLGDALLEPATDYMLVMTVGGLLFGIVGGLALVVLAILNQSPAGH